VRNELHFLSGHKNDVLSRDIQPQIAKNFGYTADELSLGVEKFMRDYYLHARVIHRVSRRLIARCRETLSRRATVQRRLRQEALADGLVVIDEEHRQALRELAAAGYVETKRGRFGGTFILRQPEPMVHDELTRTARNMGAQLDDALTFRRVVETGAAEMAARASLTMQQRESLAECLAAMYVCGPAGYRPADTRLHLAIADAAGSPMLTASVVEARVQLVELVSGLMAGRLASPPASKEDRDMLDVLVALKDEHGEPRFSASEITGMFISLMFAGHHTSSGTSSWTLIELLRHPDVYAGVIAELDDLYADGQSVSFHALRQIPLLENSLKEVLRLHPPLIILMRCATGEFNVVGHTIHRGDMVAVSPAISNRAPEDFPEPSSFIPQRYVEPRQEDLVNRWTWIPFGAGRHRCVGAAFATMQIKAIFSVLLRAYEFEMAQPADTSLGDQSRRCHSQDPFHGPASLMLR